MRAFEANSAKGAEVRGKGGTLLHARESWEFFGSPLHFIGAWSCHFHLGTLVGPWVVSTVGEYTPDGNRADYEEIGGGRKYETYVFRATGDRCSRDGCRCGQPEWTGGEIDSEGYNERGDAQRGHYAMCEKWAAIKTDEVPEDDWGIS